MKLIAGFAGGLFFAYVGSIFFQFAFATPDTRLAWSSGSLVVLWLIAIIFCLHSKTARKAWSQIFQTSAFMLFMIPIASVQAFNKATEAASTGMSDDAQINLGLAIGATSMICIVLSFVLAIIGYFLGREKKTA